MIQLPAALLLLCASASAQPTPQEFLARAAKSRVDFMRAVSEVERVAAPLPSKARLAPYLLLLDGLEKAGRAHDIASLSVDPVKDLGVVLAREAGKWLRLDTDEARHLDAFFKWSNNDTRVTAAGEAALLAAASVKAEELLVWNRGAAGALARLKDARTDAPAIQAFRELQGVITREILARRAELPRERLLEAVDAAATPQGLTEVLTFLDLETEKGAKPEDRRLVLDLSLRAARGARRLGPAAPLRFRAAAGALLSAGVERSLFEGDELDDAFCADAAAELMPSQAQTLLASLADLSEGDAAGAPRRARAVKALAAGIKLRFPYLAATHRRDFERIGARLAAK